MSNDDKYLVKLVEKISEDADKTRARQYDMMDGFSEFKSEVAKLIAEGHEKLDNRITKLENKVSFYERSALAVWGTITTVFVFGYQFIKEKVKIFL